MFDLMHHKYTCAHNKRLNRLFDPWKKHLSLAHFCHYKVTSDGYYVSISSNAEFAEFFFQKKLYVNCPFLIHPRHFVPGVNLTSVISDEDFKSQMSTIKQGLHLNLSMTFVEKMEDCVHGFCFASHGDRSLIENLYINEISLFRLFISRFKEEFKAVIHKMDDDLVHIAPLVGKIFDKPRIVIPGLTNRRKVLESMGVFVPELTSRQASIMRLMADGITLKEMAGRLDLSCRTIEKYVETLRNKFDVRSKADLLQKAQEMLGLHLLEG